MPRLPALFIASAALALAALVTPPVDGPSRTYAQESPQRSFITFGFVATADAALPSKVRAVIGDVVCGTAEVIRSDPASGFYILAVAPADQKAGCGVVGAAVQLHLLYGEVDPGTIAAQLLFRPGEALRVDLSVVGAPAAGVFSGTLPAGAGQVILRWIGSSGVPIRDAIASIPRDVLSIHYWDVQYQVFRSYVAGAAADHQTYTTVDSDDIVIVRVR